MRAPPHTADNGVVPQPPPDGVHCPLQRRGGWRAGAAQRGEPCGDQTSAIVRVPVCSNVVQHVCQQLDALRWRHPTSASPSAPPCESLCCSSAAATAGRFGWTPRQPQRRDQALVHHGGGEVRQVRGRRQPRARVAPAAAIRARDAGQGEVRALRGVARACTQCARGVCTHPAEHFGVVHALQQRIHRRGRARLGTRLQVRNRRDLCANIGRTLLGQLRRHHPL
mmetsp:Transcript_68/g.148  ORF Transcript_68/g.148 Transcript_68/m.148 type:complete len:224 (-) Transcript_68:982-1653(-)